MFVFFYFFLFSLQMIAPFNYVCNHSNIERTQPATSAYASRILKNFIKNIPLTLDAIEKLNILWAL